MENKLNINTPNKMKLGRTTFAFEKNLLANTMALHITKGDKLTTPKNLASGKVEYAAHYIKTFSKCESLCEKALNRNKSRKINVQATVAKKSMQSLKHVSDNSIAL